MTDLAVLDMTANHLFRQVAVALPQCFHQFLMVSIGLFHSLQVISDQLGDTADLTIKERFINIDQQNFE